MKFYLIIAAMIAGIVFSNQNPVLAWDKKYCDAHPNAGPPCPQPTPVPTPIPTPVSSPSEKNIQEQSQNQTQNTTNNNSNVNLNTAQGGTAYSYSAANAQGGAGGQGGNASTVNNVGNDQQSVNLVTAPLANPCSGAALSIGGTVARNSGLFNSNQYGVYGAVSIPIGKQHCNDSPPSLSKANTCFSLC